MAHKIDRDMLDLSTYVNEKEDNFTWWFDWCKDEDPATYWERRYEARKAKRRRNRKHQDSEN